MIGLRIKIEPTTSAEFCEDSRFKEIFDIANQAKMDVEVVLDGYDWGCYQFSNSLKELMKSKKIDMHKLSIDAMISEGIITNILLNKWVILSNKTIKKIASVLDVPLNELIPDSFTIINGVPELMIKNIPIDDIIANIVGGFNRAGNLLKAAELEIIHHLLENHTYNTKELKSIEENNIKGDMCY